ncbi:hypothetical protein B4915_00205 [Leucobacter massiliensis]|uniref:Uncharacterized protein n=2 Tax=Leucobacter massiliensis TaxID=1686285 RepID=A0A2S9QSV6_9MICO|nr:hypothetical protein B4915_00205 [Leucobacter massiliensis]
MIEYVNGHFISMASEVAAQAPVIFEQKNKFVAHHKRTFYERKHYVKFRMNGVYQFASDCSNTQLTIWAQEILSTYLTDEKFSELSHAALALFDGSEITPEVLEPFGNLNIMIDGQPMAITVGKQGSTGITTRTPGEENALNWIHFRMLCDAEELLENPDLITSHEADFIKGLVARIRERELTARNVDEMTLSTETPDGIHSIETVSSSEYLFVSEQFTEETVINYIAMARSALTQI